MHARAAALVAALCASAAAPAIAQTPKIDCSKAMATPEMNYCEEIELDKVDKALNAAYRATLARIDAAAEMTPKVRKEWRQAVQEAQRKWIAFRDADCHGATAYEWYGGTGATLAVLGCLRTMTLSRTKELQERNGR